MRFRWLFLCLAGFYLGTAFADPVANPAATEARSCNVYTYLDSSGQMIKTHRAEAVPDSRRSSLMTYEDCQEAAALADRDSVRPSPADRKPPPERPAPEPVPDREPEDTWDAVGEKSRRIWSLSWFAALQDWQALAMILCLAGGLAGAIGVLVVAFRTSLGWGVFSLLGPPVWIVFGLLHRHSAGPSVVANLCGSAGLAGLILWLGPF